jgi:DNA-binding protein HU-beta
MDKRTLIKKVAEDTGFTQDESRKVINSFIHQINEAVFFGMQVKINEFANFEIKVSPEQIKRNPKTGEQIKVAKHYRCKITPSKTLKDRLKSKTVY